MESGYRDLGVSRFTLSLRGRVFGMWQVFLDLLFPRACVWCGKEGELVCEPCQAHEKRLTPPALACPFCGREGSDATCSACKEQVYLDGVSAAALYGTPAVKRAFRAWKYDGDGAYGYLLCSWVWEVVPRLDVWKRLSEATVTYIPLHATRRRARGFDQAEEVAKAVAKATDRPLMTLLARTKKTKSQARLDRAERHLGELDEIFAVTGPVPECVLLCDDVFTSGTTMDAAARVLKQAGVKEVWGCVVAKGGDAHT